MSIWNQASVLTANNIKNNSFSACIPLFKWCFFLSRVQYWLSGSCCRTQHNNIGQKVFLSLLNPSMDIIVNLLGKVSRLQVMNSKKDSTAAIFLWRNWAHSWAAKIWEGPRWKQRHKSVLGGPFDFGIWSGSPPNELRLELLEFSRISLLWIGIMHTRNFYAVRLSEK